MKKKKKKKNLFPSFPQQRENTITSAPSLMVLVLKPFPSDKKIYTEKKTTNYMPWFLKKGPSFANKTW